MTLCEYKLPAAAVVSLADEPRQKRQGGLDTPSGVEPYRVDGDVGGRALRGQAIGLPTTPVPGIAEAPMPRAAGFGVIACDA